MVREIIALHIGQTGIGIGASLWDLMVHESGLDECGNVRPNKDDKRAKKTELFSEKFAGGFSPRACFIDTEPTVIDEMFLVGGHKHLFADEYCIAGNDDASTCYARGKFHSGKLIHNDVMTAIRRLLEDCDSPNAVAIYTSICGGTGSGYTAKLLPELREKLEKQTFHSHTVVPSHNFAAHVVEPYNAVLGISNTTKMIDVQFIYDNESCYKLYSDLHKLMQVDTTYSHINHLVGQVLSGISCCTRWDAQIDCDLNQFQTNLVPFPEINFISPSFVPIRHSSSKATISVHSITADSFLNNHEMCSLDPTDGEYMACGMIYRGNDIDLGGIYDAIRSVRNKFKIPFVPWVPTGFKIGICDSPIYHPAGELEGFKIPETSLIKFTNHTGIFEVFNGTIVKYNEMLNKRGYVWWYISEGMEEGEFIDSQEALSDQLKKMQTTCAVEGDEDADDADGDEE